MNRRSFIHALILTPAAASAAGSQFWRQPRSLGMTYAHQPKKTFSLDLLPQENELVRIFSENSRSVCLFGGPVLARSCHRETPWINFLIDSADFSRIKQNLFEFGVRPISTPEMPGSFIKFVHKGTVYNVMNSGIDQFCEMNHLSSRVSLIPFAHNFIIYDHKRQKITDPFDALSRSRNAGGAEIVLVARPRSLVEGFDCVLSSRFEARLLGFSPSSELLDFESFILRQSCADEDVPRLVERAVNYLPDALESLDCETAARIALSPLIRQALKLGLNVSVESIWPALETHPPEDQSMEFLALLKEGMGIQRGDTGFNDDLTMYLAKHGYKMRRSDLSGELAVSA